MNDVVIARHVPVATVVDVLRAKIPALIAVYLFGSTGTPYERAESDVDFAFLSAQSQDSVATWNTAQAIASDLGRDVDLIDLHRSSTVMAANVIAHGVRLFCGDQSRCAEFEARTLSDYARLNEERAGILDDIQNRGSVYGR